MNQTNPDQQAAMINLQMALGKIPPPRPQHCQQSPTPNSPESQQEKDVVQEVLWGMAIGDILSNLFKSGE